MYKKYRAKDKKDDLTRVTNAKDMAKITKFAKTGPLKEIGLVKNKQGKPAVSAEQAINNLCDAHFGGAIKLTQENMERDLEIAHANKGVVKSEERDWNNLQRMRKAINSFGNKKAPGLDGITPELLKLFSDELLNIFIALFNMMMSLQYTPQNMRTSKVIMLAKAGKDDYSLPKSYRPISLTPFPFKLLERLCAWNILETALKSNPFHRRQHAYRVGMSTESAISQVLNELEKGMEKGKYTLASFIDISSAFDKLDPIKATEALIKKGVNPTIAKWYKDYLTNRHAYIAIKGAETKRKITVGCPQGGVLSTILWNIAFDDLLSLFKGKGVICVGYADDGCLVVTGKIPKLLYRDMNEALEKCKTWAETYGLSLSPEKTNYMLCTSESSKTYSPLINKENLMVNGKVIERETSVKYLGLTIQHRLNWSEHIANKTEAARKMLFRLKGFIGKTWGPNPNMVRYAYTACVRPMLAYAAFAYANKLSSKDISKLARVQRLALSMTCNMRKGTPLKGMEVILDVPPIDLFLKGEAKKSAYRMIGTSDEKTAPKGHVNLLHNQLTDLEIPLRKGDHMGNTRIWEQRYSIDNGSRGEDICMGYRCYTDGSKTIHGSGSGICIMNDDKVIKTRALGLTRNATVFQSELQAIRLACTLLHDSIPKNEKVTFMVDSQAAIKALENVDTKSRLVQLTKNVLNAAGKVYDINIHWIKAHVNHKGNEIADRAAKTGSCLNQREQIAWSKSHVKAIINADTYEKWDRRWQTGHDCRQTFQFYKYIDKAKSKKIYNLSKHELGIIMRYTTGHAHLRRHNDIAGTNQPRALDMPQPLYTMEDPESVGPMVKRNIQCRVCKLESKEETPFHLARDCLPLWRARWEAMGQYIFETDEEMTWDPKTLAGYFDKINLENKPN